MSPEPTLPKKDEKRSIRSERAQTVEYAQLRADVAERLIRVCGDMPPQAFEALVDDICAMKGRWAQASSRGRDD